MKSIDEAKRSNYRYLPPKNELYSPDLPIVTIIIDCYYKLNLVKQSIQSILKQNYQNTELLLIDNGAEKLVSDYICQIYEKNTNTALIRFKENQFSWEDAPKVVVICWNAGLLHAKGEIVGHLNYDDMLSQNCCSRMARLFIENDDCTTAGPLPTAIDIDGNPTFEKFNKLLKSSNCRSRYISGKELAIDYITGNSKRYFGSQGGVLFIKKDVLIQYGGFDRASDTTQIIKLAIHGESGFDPKAKLLWRHHSNQLNKLAKNKGIVWCNILQNVVVSERIIETWSDLFSIEQVELLKKFIKNHERSEGLNVAIESLRNKNYSGFFYALKNVLNKRPSIFIYVLWFSLLEVVQMLYEKASNIVKYK